MRRQLKEERERHTRQVAQMESKIAKLSTENDQQLQQQLDQCQQEYEEKLQDIKVRSVRDAASMLKLELQMPNWLTKVKLHRSLIQAHTISGARDFEMCQKSLSSPSLEHLLLSMLE